MPEELEVPGDLERTRTTVLSSKGEKIRVMLRTCDDTTLGWFPAAS